MPELELPVHLYGTHIGTLARASDGRAHFSWTADAIRRWPLRSTPLSHALPVGSATYAITSAFFGALLPEGAWLDRLARELQVQSNDLVGIFEKVGGDLAGALSIGERTIGEPATLSKQELVATVQSAFGFTLGGGGSALPGFQRKVALTRSDGRWILGNGAVASTHILKPVADDFRAAVEGENYALGLARAVGLLEYESWVESIGDWHAIVVERYDRVRVGATVARVHQEDFAQALALPWGGDDKFERHNAAANLRAVARVLDQPRTIFDEGERETERLLRYVTFAVALGNTDAHAKNFSLLRPEKGEPVLAPLYDVAPLALGFESRQTMAMLVAGEADINAVALDHLVDEASGWGIAPSSARLTIENTLAQLVAATRTLPAHASIAKHVPGYVRGRAENLLAGEPARLLTALPPALMRQLGTPETVAQGSV